MGGDLGVSGASRLAVVGKNVLDVQAGPDSSTERVSQAILGQPAWVERVEADWSYIMTWDGCHGWAQSRWLVPRDSHQPYASGEQVVVVTDPFCDILSAPDESADILTRAVITTELEVAEPVGDWLPVVLPTGEKGFVRRSGASLKAALPPTSAEDLVRTAKRFIGVPYLWGGTTPFGLDCSGFVQLVHHIHSITLPRDAYMQAQDPRGVPIEQNDLRPGDLVFFADGQNCEKITHVGMAIGGEKFIHSSSGVGVNIAGLDDLPYQRICSCARRFLK